MQRSRLPSKPSIGEEEIHDLGYSSCSRLEQGTLGWADHGRTGVLFLLPDSLIKVMKLAPAVEGSTALGYPAGVVRGIGVVELVCLIVYVIPRTSVLGTILLTGDLGGAVATHVRVGSPLVSHILFPIYVALLIWGALYLRDPAVRGLIRLKG